MNSIIVWKKLDNTYYFRVISGYTGNYPIGYKNGYGHEVILVLEYNDLSPYYEKVVLLPFYKIIARFLIKCLEKIAN